MTTAKPFLHAKIHWDQDGQPLSSQFEDVYFSRNNGLEETRHVFLKHNQLAERFARLTIKQHEPYPLFTIAETGFGTGLNFLAAWQLFDQCAPSNAHLHFISVEKFPVTAPDLSQALNLWPELHTYTQALLKAYPIMAGYDIHRLSLAHNVSLTLIINNAACGLQQLQGSTHPSIPARDTKIDAWFLDGFSPSKNPDMWSDNLFSCIRKLSHAETTVATFSAAGLVKKGLQKVGFSITKVPGYKKRDMLTACISSTQKSLGGKTHRTAMHAIVIGAGLAGCHTAQALAKRGWRVSIIEKGEEIANASSGNPQGLVYVRLSHKRETLPQFNLACLQYAQNTYRDFWENHKHLPSTGSRCGILQLAAHAKMAQQQPKICHALNHPDNFVRQVNALEASQLAGVRVDHGGLFFPQSGWINPKILCQELLEHENIQLITQAHITELAYDKGQWQALCDNVIIASASVLVVASAEHANQFQQLSHLPLKTIRGQISYLETTEKSQQLKTALCAGGFLAPSNGQQHSLGATFNLHEKHTELQSHDHEENLKHLRELGPEIAGLFTEQTLHNLNGRVGFRCSTPDYLPIVGAAPDFNAFIEDFAPLRKDAKSPISQAPKYWPGLYVNCGYGSRGLAYTPLSAEILASQINHEPIPTNPKLVDALNPARFIVRNLIRNKI